MSIEPSKKLSLASAIKMDAEQAALDETLM